jgi:hypothetical protein
MNLSANGINQTFKTGTEPKSPYYYLTASLDLAGLAYGTYYFNFDNDFAYASDPTYRKFVSVDENVVLSEVTVYTNPPLETESGVVFHIGGAANTNGAPVKVDWAAPAGYGPVSPPGYSGAFLSVAELNEGSVNYFGHEGGHFPYYTDNEMKEDLSNAYRYLAVTLEPAEDVAKSVAPAAAKVVSAPAQDLFSRLAERAKSVRYPRVLTMAARSHAASQKKMTRRVPRALPGGPSVIDQGRLTVILKVYPKDQ